MNCQAIVDDWVHLSVHAPAQRIIEPGSKGCSRKARSKVGKLCLCTTHARMAKEGFLSESGEVANRLDIRNVRKYGKITLNSWAKDLPVEPLAETALKEEK